MGFDALKKEREEIYKERKISKEINLTIAILSVISLFFIMTNFKGNLSDLIFQTPNVILIHYPMMFFTEIVIILGAILWWKGNNTEFPVIWIRKRGYIVYPVITKKPLFKIIYRNLKKVPLIGDTVEFLNYEGKEKELDKFFYKAPIQTDELSRASNVIFTDYTIKDVFKDDYKDIVSLFRGKDFEEKEKTLNDLISIIEGVFKEYSKGLSRLHINEKDLKSPFRVKNLLDASVFDRKEGKIYFSTKQMIETIEDFTKEFEKFIDNYSKYKTRIHKLYAEELTKKEVRKKIILYFKLVMFRKYLKLYMNIPSGWMVIKLEDYNAKAIFSTIDRLTLTIIDSRNQGNIKGFPDDRFVRMFQLLYHYFFNETSKIKFYNNVFGVLMPDKTAKEMEDFIMKNKDELSHELVKEENADSN